MIENTNTKQFYPGPILNNTLEITDFLFNDAEQIKIKHSKLNEEGILIDVDLNYPTDYEVTKVLPSDINAAEAALTASTGQIMLKNVDVLAGEKLTVYRVSLIIQDKDYPRTGAFPAATHEGALDYLTMQNQEQKDEIDRALKVPISTQNFEGSLPLPIPSRALKINNDGTGFEMSEFDPDLALVTTEEFKTQSQQAAAEALASQNAATEQATIAAQQANIATEKTIEVVQAKEEAVTTIKDAVTTIKDVETNSLAKINSEFNKANEWFERLNAIPYIPVGTVLPTTGAIDESLGYQRYANGQLIANVSSQAPDLVKFLEFQEAHAPNLLCAETEWQTALTLSTLGQVGKYVWNKEEDSIRIPRIVNIQGMMDMNTVGNMVEAGLPNITGSQSFGTWRNNQFESAGLLKESSGCVAPASKKLLAGGNSIQGFDTNTNTRDTFHIDASRSSAVYGKSDTVQEESILYPYVLQIATGVQYKTPVQNELERIVPYSFGNHKYSNVLLNNPAWMRSVGQWNSAKTHGDYYNWLCEERRNPKDIPAVINVNSFGAFTNSDGLLSDFQALKGYVTLPKSFNPGTSTWEQVYSVITGSDIQTRRQHMHCVDGSNNKDGTGCTFLWGHTNTAASLGKTTLLISINGRWYSLDNPPIGTKVYEPNTKYIFKISYNGEQYKLQYSEDNGLTFIDDIVIDLSTPITPNSQPDLLGDGWGRDGTSGWPGSIDLNESYININGQRWWSGVKSPMRLHTEDYGPEDWVINQSEQTFRLPLVADRVLVDKREGNDWYNLYSDGYLEQGQSAYITTIGYAEIPTEEQRTVNKYLYFYVGGVAKNEHLVDVGRIEEKVDTLIPDNSRLISGYGMPSNKYIDLTLGASGTGYVMPANGWLYFRVMAIANKTSQLRIQRGASTLDNISFSSIVNTNNDQPAVTAVAPAQKGETQYVYYDQVNTSTYVLRFYYAEGEQ